MWLANSKEQLRVEENQLREQVSALSVEQKRQYYAQEIQHIKDPDTYAALNWAFVAGLHHFYLGKWSRGLINLVLMTLGVIFYFIVGLSLLGAALVVFVFAIELPQLFNSENVIHDYNNQVMKRLLVQFNHEYE
jgi:TM2 domain-containing membrane protein YozV